MKKTLIVFFSYSGNTRFIVNKILENVYADILELKPLVPYSDDYQKVVDDEHNSESSQYLPEIEEVKISLELYDTIILGTPVWWYRSAPVVRTFLTNNNLGDKTIIPFATNGGWLGRTFNEIKSLCPNANIINEMNIVFDGNNLKTNIDVINEWIKDIKENIN